MEMALSGEKTSAEFLHGAGIVNRLTEPGRALVEALAWAERLLENGPTALAATAMIMSRTFDWTDEQAWVEQRILADRASRSQDRAEGLRAFAEKRKPKWTGR